MKHDRQNALRGLLAALLALTLLLGCGALAEVGTIFPWRDYTLDVALVSTDPAVIDVQNAPDGGALVLIKLISLNGGIKTEDIQEYFGELRFRDGDGDEFTTDSLRLRGVAFDATTGKFSTNPTQEAFELLYFLSGKEEGAVAGAKLVVPTGKEGERIIVPLDKAPHALPTEPAEEASAEQPAEEAPVAAPDDGQASGGKEKAADAEQDVLFVAPAAEPEPEPEPTAEPEPEPVAENSIDQDVADVLKQCAEGVTDEWVRSIYLAGARGASVEVGEKKTVCTFMLRGFDPKLKELGKFAGENKAGFLTRLLQNIESYELECSLELKDGEFTQKSVKALKERVKKAAANAKKSFQNKTVQAALTDALFYTELASAIKKPEQLLTPPEAYTDWVAEHEDTLEGLSAEKWAAFFYGQTKQSLDVSGGPYAMTLKGICVDMAALLDAAVADALEKLAFLTYDERWDDDRIEKEFLLALAENAVSMRKKAKTSFAISINLGVSPFHGNEYEELLEQYTYAEAYERLILAEGNLPEFAAQPFPKAGWLSGSKKGTQVNVKAPKDSGAYYIQLRDYNTDEIAVAGFVRPGSTCTLRVPQGDYYFVMASGAVWYGEENLFGYDTEFTKTGLFEVANSNYYHTVTLKVTQGGNMPIYGADEDDLR